MVIETKNLSVFREIFCGVWKWLCYNSSMGPSYDNGLGSFGNASSNGAGGAIISSSNSGVGVGLPSESKKRWPVFVAIFLGIAAVVALVLMAVVPRGSGGNTASGFDNYANYVLFGDANNESIKTSQYDSTREYYFEAMLAGDEAGDTIEKVKEYQQAFRDTLTENDSVLIDIMSEQEGYIEVIEKILTKEMVTNVMLLEAYKVNGREGVENKYGGYYSMFDDSEKAYENWFAESYREFLGAWLNIFDFYESKNCVSEFLDDDCIAGVLTDEERIELAALLDSGNETTVRMGDAYDVGDKYIQNIFEMKNIIYGDESDDTEPTSTSMENEDAE